MLVLHAWWGLNDTIKAFCDRLAHAGFVAFAPDLYHGKVVDNIADAETLGLALDANHLQAKAEIAAATRFLNDQVGQTDRGLVGPTRESVKSVKIRVPNRQNRSAAASLTHTERPRSPARGAQKEGAQRR